MSVLKTRAPGRPLLRHPAQAIVLAFGVAVVIGTGLLMLPVARAGPEGAPALTALFTATSAVCVTGLITVDTPSYWSGFGQAVILGLIQVGTLTVLDPDLFPDQTVWSAWRG